MRGLTKGQVFEYFVLLGYGPAVPDVAGAQHFPGTSHPSGQGQVLILRQAEEYKESFDDIFRRSSMPREPSFYVNVPSRM